MRCKPLNKPLGRLAAKGIFMRTTGQNIKEARKEAGLTLQDIANETKLSISFLSDIERGRTLPSLKTLQKIANVYNRNIASFLIGVHIGGLTTHAADSASPHAEWCLLQSGGYACTCDMIMETPNR